MYGAAPTVDTTASLSGGPFSATFMVQQFNASKWLATINGTDGYNGSTRFKGAGVSTVNTISLNILRYGGRDSEVTKTKTLQSWCKAHEIKAVGGKPAAFISSKWCYNKRP